MFNMIWAHPGRGYWSVWKGRGQTIHVEAEWAEITTEYSPMPRTPVCVMKQIKLMNSP